MAKSKKLFTIGYEQTPPKAVLDELEQAGVKLLVDVRAIASSRRPGFSKTQLAAGLDERGISYLHLRGLGTPKQGREAARSGKHVALRSPKIRSRWTRSIWLASSGEWRSNRLFQITATIAGATRICG